MAAPSHPLLGTTIADKYKIVRVLGRGGLGIVFEAENAVLSRMVAVKVVLDGRNDGFERLEREARMVAMLQHPNVCDVYDLGRLPMYGPYLVCERLYGETIAQRVKREAALPIALVVDVLSQVLSGLHAAHGRHIIHRDMKPQNVFLVDRLGCPPLAKILDFGLAKDLTVGSARTLTKPGFAVGTPEYMAPERLRGVKESTPAMDIFSVGVIAYEALTGVYPFSGATTVVRQARILRDDPTPLRELRPSIPRMMEDVIAQALAKNPAERFADAAVFLNRLRECVPAIVAEEPPPESTSTVRVVDTT